MRREVARCGISKKIIPFSGTGQKGRSETEELNNLSFPRARAPVVVVSILSIIFDPLSTSVTSPSHSTRLLIPSLSLSLSASHSVTQRSLAPLFPVPRYIAGKTKEQRPLSLTGKGPPVPFAAHPSHPAYPWAPSELKNSATAPFPHAAAHPFPQHTHPHPGGRSSQPAGTFFLFLNFGGLMNW